MPYIKSGIVTRIDIIKNQKESLEYIQKHFNLELFNQLKDYYLLKENILQENLSKYRKEYMNFSEYKNDSLNNCEAYITETNIEKLLENKIHLSKNNKNYYFENYEDTVFETDKCYYTNDKINIIISLIPIFWDINKLVSEDFNIITVTVNNLTRKAMKNILKDASWFSVI